jgi:hypothetical protein
LLPDQAVAEFGEQTPGQNQVDHHPGRQQPLTLLNPAGRGQDRVDHVERDEPGQLAEMTGREDARGYRDRACYGNLIDQAEFLVLGCLGVTNLDTGTALLASRSTHPLTNLAHT